MSTVVPQIQRQPVVVPSETTVVVEVGTPTVVVTGLMGPPGSSELRLLTDVDMGQVQDGGVLVYRQATQRWAATNTLDSQLLDGGQF